MLRLLTGERRTALGAQRRVLCPGSSCVYPDHLSCRLHRPDDQWLVSVGHYHRTIAASLGQRIAPTAAECLDLVMAVQLVSAEVEQHEDLWAAEPDEVRHHALVGFQDGDVGVRANGQGGGDAGVEVRPVGVVHEPIAGTTKRGTYGGRKEVGG